MKDRESITEKVAPPRRKVLVSGYYGFDNLGDEAILEVLLKELQELIDIDDIVVLSNNPEKTQEIFSVASFSRWDLAKVFNLFQEARLFVSGGGGLFQDTSSIKSVAYYSALHHLAYLTGVKAIVYAQGLGPLSSPISKFLTKQAFRLTDIVTVRDPKSVELLGDLDVKSELTSDPVWCLEKELVPDSMGELFRQTKKDDCLLVGLSLRSSSNFDRTDLENLAKSMLEALPDNTYLVPLLLQKEKDSKSLSVVSEIWKAQNRKILEIDYSQIEKPSQFLDLISRLDFVIGMRLHSLIMALSSGVCTFGLSYDPKVEAVMKEFDQPFLNLTNENASASARSQVSDLLKGALLRRQESAALIKKHREQVRHEACKNRQFLAKILN